MLERAKPCLKPGEILVNARRIDNHQIFGSGSSISIKVVDYSTSFVAQQRILRCTDVEFSDVVSQSLVKKRGDFRATHRNFTHMGNVKNPTGFADRQVLVRDAGVLNRHFPAAEFNQFCAELLVSAKERS